jgi:hypothetical protein
VVTIALKTPLGPPQVTVASWVLLLFLEFLCASTHLLMMSVVCAFFWIAGRLPANVIFKGFRLFLIAICIRFTPSGSFSFALAASTKYALPVNCTDPLVGMFNPLPAIRSEFGRWAPRQKKKLWPSPSSDLSGFATRHLAELRRVHPHRPEALQEQFGRFRLTSCTQCNSLSRRL